MKKSIKKIIYIIYYFTLWPLMFFGGISIPVLVFIFTKNAVFWLALPLALECSLQSFKLLYEIFATKCQYTNQLLNTISWCWFIYKILNSLFITAILYSAIISATICDYFHLGNTTIYIIICTMFACIFTTISSSPYFIRKARSTQKQIKRSIEADANRFFILIAYMVFLIVTCIKTNTIMNNIEIVTSCFLIYLAFDRLYSTIISNLPIYKETFDWMKEETEEWLKKKNEDYIKRNTTDIKS